jgi:hypothetical protein
LKLKERLGPLHQRTIGIHDRIAGILPGHVLVACPMSASAIPGIHHRPGPHIYRSTRGSLRRSADGAPAALGRRSRAKRRAVVIR